MPRVDTVHLKAMPTRSSMAFLRLMFSTIGVHVVVDKLGNKLSTSMTTRLRDKRPFFNQPSRVLSRVDKPIDFQSLFWFPDRVRNDIKKPSLLVSLIGKLGEKLCGYSLEKGRSVSPALACSALFIFEQLSAAT